MVAALKSVTGPTALSIGRFPHDSDRVSRTVTYTNSGDSPVTLALALTERGWDGREGHAVSLSTAQLTVPAHGKASTELTVDPAGAAQGAYGGTLTATAEGISLRTPVSWYRAPEPVPSHQLTVKLVDREGQPLDSSEPYVFPQLEQADLPANDPFDHSGGQVPLTRTAPGTWTGPAPEGQYVVGAAEYRNTPGLARTTLLTHSDVNVDSDTETVLDAREAVRVQARTPQPTHTYNQAMTVQMGGVQGAVFMLAPGRTQSAELWAMPTTAPAKGTLTLQETYTLGERTVTATARIDGRPVDLRPEYEPLQLARALTGRRELPVVYADAGSGDAFAKTDVKGKAALVKIAVPDVNDPAWSFRAALAAQEAAKQAEAAGAALILPYLDVPGARPLPPLSEGPTALAFPLLGIRQTDGEKLRTQAAPVLKLEVKSAPAYIYNLHYAPPLASGIPKELVHRVEPGTLKRTRTRYHSEVSGLAVQTWAVAFEKDRSGSYSSPRVYLPAPAEFDQYYGGVTGDQAWIRTATLTDGRNRYTQLDWEAYRGRTESYFSGPTTMVAPEQDLVAGVVRRKASDEGDWLVASPYLGDSETGHFVQTDFGDIFPFTYRLFRDGAEIQASRLPGLHTPYFEVPRDEATYRMQGTFTLPESGYFAPNSKVKRYAPKVENIWTFRSRPPTGKECSASSLVCNVPPLLQLTYDLHLDLNNQARAGRPHRIEIGAAPQRHSAHGGRITDLSLSWSADGGTTWHKAQVVGTGGHRAAVLDHTATARGSAVWLKTEARDASGGTITQTVQVAYTLR